MLQLYSTGELARLLGVPAHRIEYAHATGHLDEPRLRFVGKRAYDGDDVRRVAAYFGVEVAGTGCSEKGKVEHSCDTSTRI
jgi:MerR HTH family regulatory protein